MRLLELKIPPPLVAVVTAAAMFLLARSLPLITLPAAWNSGVALVLLALGALIDLSGLMAFRRSKTTVNPMTPQRTTALVSAGVYRFTRNPMYLGMVFMLVAWAAYLSSAWALVGVPAFMAYISRFQIQPEERALAARFGQSYADYCAHVRRWR